MIMEISFVKVWQFYSPRTDFKFKTWAKRRRVQIFVLYDQLSCWHCQGAYGALSCATGTMTWRENGECGGDLTTPVCVVGGGWGGFYFSIVGKSWEGEKARVWFTSALRESWDCESPGLIYFSIVRKRLESPREPSRLQVQSIVDTSHKAKGAVATEPVSHLWLATPLAFKHSHCLHWHSLLHVLILGPLLQLGDEACCFTYSPVAVH